MDFSLACLLLVTVHSSWGASLHPLNKVFPLANNIITKDANQAILASIRGHNPLNMPSRAASGLPGPHGQTPRRIDAGGLSPQVPLSKLTPSQDKSTTTATRSAFSVYKTMEQVGNITDVLYFDSITTNVGSGYDPTNSVFTCGTAGMYVFSYTIITQDYPIVILGKNRDILATVFRSYDGAGLYDTISNQVVVQLAAGDQVYLMYMGYDQQSVYGDPYYKYTTFSGYQI